MSIHRLAFLPLAALALAAMATGCGSGSQNVPPADQLYFPTGLAIDDPTGAEAHDYLYVTNGNTDLRYSGGTVNALDIAKMEQSIGKWRTGAVPPGCARDTFLPQQIDCDATGYFVAHAAAEVGNFAGLLRVQHLVGAAGGLARRLFFPVRGDPSLTYVDVYMDSTGAIQSFQCTGTQQTSGMPRCDDNHRLDHLANASHTPLPNEPFGIFLDETLGRVYLSHQAGGYVTLVNAPPSGEPPTLVDTRNGLVGTDSNGFQEAFGIAARDPGKDDGLVYVTSRSTATFGVFQVGDDRILPVLPAVPLLGLRSGADVRGLAFADGGDRMLLVDRQPSSLLVVDTALGTSGIPHNRVTEVIDVCGDPSFVRVWPGTSGDRAYVVCFSQSAVWDVDVESGQVVSQISVGAGPNAIAFLDRPPRAYVADFSESSIAVIDLQEGSPTFDQVVLKLGARPIDATPGAP